MALFVVGTPIGNLGDLTERAKEVIRNSKIFICEQREYGLKLLNFLQARPSSFIVLPKYESRIKKIVEMLKDSDGVLTVSAGTPGVSDPGARLVNACIENGVKVIPVPGPSAVTTALSVCGFEASRFIFVGFLPKKGRVNFLKKLKEGISFLPFSPLVVIYESPHKVVSTVEILSDVFGENSRLFLAREMTKIHEEFIRGEIKDVLAELKKREKIKGEITLILEVKNSSNLEQDDNSE